MAEQTWPALPLAEWEKTYATLHMWTQIVGKAKLALTPKINHWWNAAFYITPRGLTTSTLYYEEKALAIEFDFISHRLSINCDNGVTAAMGLVPCSVADFYQKFMAMLGELGLKVKIRPIPDEVDNPVPFAEDYRNNSYDGEYVNRLWRILLHTDKVFNQFRSSFLGKCSPVHFFWGSFDLAVTRFSGRAAPAREGADSITAEAYSHEVISHGFWPGRRASGAVEGQASTGNINYPAFYAYAVPEPEGFSQAKVFPSKAFYHQDLKEWILPYDVVRESFSPEQMLLEFMQSTYEAGASLAGWNRAALEREGSAVYDLPVQKGQTFEI